MTTEPKLSPCGCSCCGVRPLEVEAGLVVGNCEATCIFKVIIRTFGCSLEKWNLFHKTILAQRKADFEAGYRRRGLSPYSTDEDAPGQFKANSADKAAEASQMFEDYLTKEREK